MQDEPTPCEILEAIVTFLRHDVMPHVDGGLAFQLRVASNALDLVRREIAAPPEVCGREHSMLQALLGRDGSVEELTGELVRRIANGAIDRSSPALRALLWQTTEAKLAVDQPNYAGLQRARALRADPSRQET